MSGRYRHYPEYKDSGLKWLGEVPQHWLLKKIAWQFSAQKGQNGQVLTKEYCGLMSGDFPVYSGQTENQGVMGWIDNYEFNTGDEGVIFSTTVGAKAMHLSHLRGKFSLSQNCMIISPTTSDYNTRFSYYHFQPLFKYERGLIPDHMQASFRMDDLYQYKVAAPPIKEQHQIATFLDHETAKIDTLINKQQKLIDLLKEKRQAVISHAVTKGLNPDALMKDSGVEWLEEVPAHWKVLPVKREFDVRLGKMLRPIPSSTDDELLPYLRAANIQWSGVDTSDVKKMWFSPAEKEQLLLESGDLLVSEGGDIGRSAIWCNELTACYFQNSINRVRSAKESLTKFLYYWMVSIKSKGYIDVLCNKLTIAHFTAEKLQAVAFLCPPIPEQKAIVNFLDHETAKIDNLIDKTQQSIELSKERRTALISAAVTGKIDVRNWQPPPTHRETQ